MTNGRVDRAFGTVLVANSKADRAKKVAVFLTVLGVKAYALLENLLAPTCMKPTDKVYRDFVKAMKDHLKPKTLIIAERFKFHHRNQREGETVAQYAWPSYASSRNSAISETTSKKPWEIGLCVVCRAKSFKGDSWLKRTLRWKRTSLLSLWCSWWHWVSILWNFYEISHGMETANRQASELQASAKCTTEVLPSAARDAIQWVAQPQQPKPNSAGLLSPCYRCGKIGHSPDKCFLKTQKCRSCGKKGHIVNPQTRVVHRRLRNPMPLTANHFQDDRLVIVQHK